jgi:hypothetical protein
MVLLFTLSEGPVSGRSRSPKGPYALGGFFSNAAEISSINKAAPTLGAIRNISRPRSSTPK